MFSIKRYILLLLLLFKSASLFSQMPDWKLFRDREGNKYYIDQKGKIRITGGSILGYRPVSSLGIDYYINYGIELIKDHHLTEGITVLKSILAIPEQNNRIYRVQVKAAEVINKLKKRHGYRFNRASESASLILFKQGSSVNVIDDQMLYSFKAPDGIVVIRKKNRRKKSYKYSGLLLGIKRLNSSATLNKDGVYDMLLAVDSEKYLVKVRDVAQAEEKWKGIAGFDNLKRVELQKNDNCVIYRFMNSSSPSYSGIEGIFINGCFSYFIRVVSSRISFNKNRDIMKKIVYSFKTVSEGK